MMRLIRGADPAGAGARPFLASFVYRAPWHGPNGEVVLLAITSTGHLLTGAPVVVPLGADPLAAADALLVCLLEVEVQPRPALTLLRGGLS